MPRFKNVSPLGDLDVPDLGQIVEAGEEFEVSEELAPYFAAQPSNYQAVDAAAEALAVTAAERQAEVDAAALAVDEPAASTADEPEPVETGAEAPKSRRAVKPTAKEEGVPR